MFLVDRYELTIEVWPIVPEQDKGISFGGRGRKRIVPRCSNGARISRFVTFSPENTRQDLFKLRYSTRNQGCISSLLLNPSENKASPSDQGRYEDQGLEVTYCFAPQPGRRYAMQFEVYGGFDPGERNAHFHLHPSTRYQAIFVTLDLREYIRNGYPVPRPPALHVHDEDPQDHDLCKLRGLGHECRQAPTARAGVWSWRVFNKTEGVLDLMWDLEGPETQIVKTDPVADERRGLVASNLQACQLFDLLMGIVAEFGPTYFRDVPAILANASKRNRLSKTVVPPQRSVSYSALVRALKDVEEMLAHPAFLKSPVRLFHRTPGRPSKRNPETTRPTEQAEKALAMLRPLLADLLVPFDRRK
jgi:hypothetical protein